jgi:hypothetical protein
MSNVFENNVLSFLNNLFLNLAIFQLLLSSFEKHNILIGEVNTPRARGVAQLVQHLPSKHKALSSNKKQKTTTKQNNKNPPVHAG